MGAVPASGSMDFCSQDLFCEPWLHLSAHTSSRSPIYFSALVPKQQIHKKTILFFWWFWVTFIFINLQKRSTAAAVSMFQERCFVAFQVVSVNSGWVQCFPDTPDCGRVLMFRFWRNKLSPLSIALPWPCMCRAYQMLGCLILLHPHPVAASKCFEAVLTQINWTVGLWKQMPSAAYF